MNRKEVLAEVRESVEAMSNLELSTALDADFFMMHDVIKKVRLGLLTNKNIVLYGPGGFGKTTLVKAMIKQLKLESSTVVGYKDMEPEALIGVVDMKKLVDESIYETAFEHSVFRNPGVLVLEEFFDCKPSTAATLKDILTEGGLRQGTKFTESLVSSVIICSNKNPEELATDDSLKAFYQERFPIVIRVAWDTFTHSRYKAFLKHAETGMPNQQISILAELCARTVAKAHNMVSPRVVLDAVDIIKASSVHDLDALNGLDTSAISEVIEAARIREDGAVVKKVCDSVQLYMSKVIVSDDLTVNRAINYLRDLKDIRINLQNLSSTYPNEVKKVHDVLVVVNAIQNTLSNSLTQNVETTNNEAIKEMFTI